MTDEVAQLLGHSQQLGRAWNRAHAQVLAAQRAYEAAPGRQTGREWDDALAVQDAVMAQLRGTARALREATETRAGRVTLPSG